jgi:orotidine-5'-phosphate decarboxylase
MSGSWGCPHELNDLCSKVNNLPCDPGMKGCVLYGRFVFANDEKNEPLRRKRARRHRRKPGYRREARHRGMIVG